MTTQTPATGKNKNWLGLRSGF